jgi:hypothetical protein
VAIYYLAVAASKYRDLEAELADAAAHAIHGGVVLARVARVENQPVDGLDFDFQCLRRFQHPEVSIHTLQDGVVFDKGSFGSCALGAGLANRTSIVILPQQLSSCTLPLCKRLVGG